MTWKILTSVSWFNWLNSFWSRSIGSSSLHSDHPKNQELISASICQLYLPISNTLLIFPSLIKLSFMLRTTNDMPRSCIVFCASSSNWILSPYLNLSPICKFYSKVQFTVPFASFTTSKPTQLLANAIWQKFSSNAASRVMIHVLLPV